MFDVSGQAIRFAIAVSVSLLFGNSQAIAQSGCSIKDIVQAENATSAAAENFKCLLDRIDKLEKEVAPFRNAKGAVIAFDRSGRATADESAGYCPPGWKWFEPSGGRMLIGAGNHPNNLDEKGDRLRRYPSYLEDPKDSVGGEEQHTLTVEEMPTHLHYLGGLDKGGAPLGWIDVADVSFTGKIGGPAVLAISGGADRQNCSGDRCRPTGEKGGSKPHNNMPPYIALYFCKKEG